ncbi:MAG: hypothetical protein ACHQZR_06625, partial [Candidatus Limnocylindrales bacterium]
MRHQPSPATLLVIGDGHVPLRATLDRAWPGWSDGISWVVGADGGAARAATLGLTPDLVVGDLDSLPATDVARLTAAGVPIRPYPAEKDASDLE